MQISLTGHHVDITDSLRAYVDSKLERLERHFDNVTNVHVILSVEKLRQKAENLHFFLSPRQITAPNVVGELAQTLKQGCEMP